MWVWCLWELGREGVSTLTVQSCGAGPLLARLPTELWSGNYRKQKTEFQTFTFCLETLSLPSERAGLSDYWGGNGAKYFQSCFPPTCLIWFDGCKNWGEKIWASHKDYLSLNWSDCHSVGGYCVVQFNETKRLQMMERRLGWVLAFINLTANYRIRE